MICLSVFAEQLQICLRDLSEVDAVELRVDRRIPGRGTLRRLRMLNKTVIAACRRGKKTDRERVGILEEMLRRGVDYLDLDMVADRRFFHRLSREARERKTGIIASYHDPRKTPDVQTLQAWIRRGFQSRCHWAKVVCRVGRERDLAVLLSLYDSLPRAWKGRCIVFGMGPGGRVSRIMAHFLGCPVQYTTLPYLRSTAGGQWDARDYKEVLEKCHQKNPRGWR